jgi:SAM-dependent methyltransferase
MGSLDDPTYERCTRAHYQDPVVARRYASRQSLARSPVEWLVGLLEKRQVRGGLVLLGLRRNAHVLDSPAGSGKLQQTLTKGAAFYCAADISPAMLSYARPERATVVADAEQLPFRPKSFDTTVCVRLLHRVSRAAFEAMLVEAIRASRVGVVFSYAGSPRFPRFHRLLQLLTRRTGQRVLRITPADLRGLVRSQGGLLLADNSISLGLTAERVAVVVLENRAGRR